MIRHALSLAIGVLFGLGLSAGSMVDPTVVLGFLDVTGRWDPRLLLVMAGGLAVSLVGFRAMGRHGKTVFGGHLHLPTAKQLDARLIGGAALFGIGWGMAGYCPGPALASLVVNPAEATVFLPAMLAGSWLAKRFVG